jgi:hypothetical protein
MGIDADARPAEEAVKLPRATRMPMAHGKGKTLKSLLAGVEDEDQRERLAQAIRMDNRGLWFLCKSHWRIAQLERRFAEELVAGVLYERIGGMLQGDKPYIYMQILLVKSTLQQLHPNSEPEWIEVPTDSGTPDHGVITALKEIRVRVVSPVPDIRDVIESGRY